MATYTWVDLKIPEAALLADLHGVLGDLRRAREYTELLNSNITATPPNWAIAEPLSVAITVTYCRAFAGGVRYRLTERDLSSLSEDQLDTHRYLINYRDKHVAHSVNAFEENIARANYCVERVETDGITGIGYGGGRLASLGGKEMNAVFEISTILERELTERIRDEEKRLLAIVRAMPIDKVLSAGQKVFKPSKVQVSRRRQ